MKQFFDAHVYVANWMSAIFKVRVPIETISERVTEAMAVRHSLDFKATKTHWVITWSLSESEDYDRFGMEDGRGWMARLAPVRDELLRGDFRSLYIGWLAAVTGEMVDEDESEPLPLGGLGNLTAAQQALAEFLDVDDDPLAGAGMGSPALQDEADFEKETDVWLGGLPHDDVTAFMKLLLSGRGQEAERTLTNRFASWRRGLRNDRSDAPRRTVEEIRKNAGVAETVRIEKKKLEEARRVAKLCKEREAYLKALAKDFPKAWKAVQQTVERGLGQAYEEACRALGDLSEAYSVHASRMAFQQEMRKFMLSHMRRKSLIQRLAKAGIWHES